MTELAALLTGHNVSLTGSSDVPLLALSPRTDLEIPLESEQSLVQHLSTRPESSSQVERPRDIVVTLDEYQLSSQRLMQDAQSEVHFDLHPPVLTLPSPLTTHAGHTALWSALLCGLRVVPPPS